MAGALVDADAFLRSMMSNSCRQCRRRSQCRGRHCLRRRRRRRRRCLRHRYRHR